MNFEIEVTEAQWPKFVDKFSRLLLSRPTKGNIRASTRHETRRCLCIHTNLRNIASDGIKVASIQTTNSTPSKENSRRCVAITDMPSNRRGRYVPPHIWWGAFFLVARRKWIISRTRSRNNRISTLVVELSQVSWGAYLLGGVAAVKNAESVQARPTTNPRKPCVFHRQICREIAHRNELQSSLSSKWLR